VESKRRAAQAKNCGGAREQRAIELQRLIAPPSDRMSLCHHNLSSPTLGTGDAKYQDQLLTNHLQPKQNMLINPNGEAASSSKEFGQSQRPKRANYRAAQKQGALRPPSTPPLVPTSKKSMRDAFNSSWWRTESFQWELPPSATTSPGYRRCLSCAMVESVASPCGT
jgi:hypothetical protein